MPVLLVMAVAGCSSQQRLVVGPSYGGAGRGTGVVASAHATMGSTIAAVIGVEGSVDDATGGGAGLVGLEVQRDPLPDGAHATFEIGPRLEAETHFEARAALGYERGFYREDDDDATRMLTVGVELFVSNVAFTRDNTFVGVALTIGRFQLDKMSHSIAP